MRLDFLGSRGADEDRCKRCAGLLIIFCWAVECRDGHPLGVEAVWVCRPCDIKYFSLA